MRRLSVFLLAALSVSANVPNPGTCGPWVPQTNGIKWRLCRDVHNNSYCELQRGRTTQPMQCPD